jgi:hypothetical protein
MIINDLHSVEGILDQDPSLYTSIYDLHCAYFPSNYTKVQAKLSFNVGMIIKKISH